MTKKTKWVQNGYSNNVQLGVTEGEREKAKTFQKIFLMLYAILNDTAPEKRIALQQSLSDRPVVQDAAEVVLEKLDEADHKLAPMWARAQIKATMKIALMKRPDRIAAELVEEKAELEKHYGVQKNYGMF